jgi:hypothetical protein
MYYQVEEEKPTANITVNKGRRKIKDKSIYLNNGQEFEIELFNPTSDTILCKIWINNKIISRSGIVLRPGDRVFLERYIDDPVKFKFDTYQVGNSAAVKKAIEKNGLVKVEFYREDTTPAYVPDITWTTNNNNHTRTYFNNTSGEYIPPATFTTSGSDLKFFDTNASGVYGSSMDMNSTLSMDSVVGSTTSTGGQSKNLRRKSVKGKSRSLETGRVEKGSTSDQNFTRVNKKFEFGSFHKVEYQIKPMSTMRMDAKEAVKTSKHCTNCGKKGKYTHKFCSSCGNRL